MANGDQLLNCLDNYCALIEFVGDGVDYNANASLCDTGKNLYIWLL